MPCCHKEHLFLCVNLIGSSSDMVDSCRLFNKIIVWFILWIPISFGMINKSQNIFIRITTYTIFRFASSSVISFFAKKAGHEIDSNNVDFQCMTQRENICTWHVNHNVAISLYPVDREVFTLNYAFVRWLISVFSPDYSWLSVIIVGDLVTTFCCILLVGIILADPKR